MTAKERDKKLEMLVEQKLLEFLGDPDAGRALKKSFLNKLRKNMRKPQSLVSHSNVLKKYGVH